MRMLATDFFHKHFPHMQEVEVEEIEAPLPPSWILKLRRWQETIADHQKDQPHQSKESLV